jgi:cob(I)alamin adenosyltransferase
MSIATKTGDNGTTALMFGKRVPKNHPRVEAYGTVDELNSALGVARASSTEPFIAEAILSIQKELVTVMGELAVAEEDRTRYETSGYEFVQAPMVDRLTALVDDLEKNHKISFKDWATPGATPGAAALDLARTVCRRAERRVVEISEIGESINPEIVRYLNRLSDLCWLYARFIETRLAAKIEAA